MAVVFPVIGATEWNRGSWMPNRTSGKGSHAAIDIYADRGAPIVTPVSGTVKSLGSTSVGGNWIQVQGDDGYTYYFAHMNAPTTLSKGQSISGGQQIGTIGNSGSARSTSTHVHFTIKKNGVSVNPINMLENSVVVPKVGGSGGEIWDRKDYDGPLPPGVVASGVPNQSFNASDSVGSAEIYAYDQTPSTAEQFAQYRDELLASFPQEAPVKQRAAWAMRASLQGMADMVRRDGFKTIGDESGTGIQEIERKEVIPDGATSR